VRSAGKTVLSGGYIYSLAARSIMAIVTSWMACLPNVKYHRGICSGKLTPAEVEKAKKDLLTMTNELNQVLYAEERKTHVDPELMDVVVLESKRPHFGFLTGKTIWRATGDWEGYPNEQNIVLQVQFRDAKNERYGKRATELFKQINELLIGEDLLYTRTVPVEETSLP
jgi:hypothetical protein